jgi:hypothetical protein
VWWLTRLLGKKPLRDKEISYLRQLRQCPVLPAKANLLSKLAKRSETPLYIDLPSPIREVSK